MGRDAGTALSIEKTICRVRRDGLDVLSIACSLGEQAHGFGTTLRPQASLVGLSFFFKSFFVRGVEREGTLAAYHRLTKSIMYLHPHAS